MAIESVTDAYRIETITRTLEARFESALEVFYPR
jgi:hypothetical protein